MFAKEWDKISDLVKHGKDPFNSKSRSRSKTSNSNNSNQRSSAVSNDSKDSKSSKNSNLETELRAGEPKYEDSESEVIASGSINIELDRRILHFFLMYFFLLLDYLLLLILVRQI